MINAQEFFRGRKPAEDRLIEYGFERRDGEFVLKRHILGGQFTLNVSVSGDKTYAEVYDNEAECPYYLFAVEGAQGSFVGEVRAEYESVLADIAKNCFTAAGEYIERLTESAVEYAGEKYGSAPEHLWKDENFILRRADNNKWYAAFLTVRRDRLGIGGEGLTEVVNLIAAPGDVERLVDGERFLPAYHMNKKYWLSVPLDGRVPLAEIEELLDASYLLAKGKK